MVLAADAVIENGLDFILRAATDLHNEDLTEEQQAKYSTIMLYEGIELILKARLMQEHWTLVLQTLDKVTRQKFERGEFQSVGYGAARERLAEVCDVEIDKQAHRQYEELRKLRNRYVHFASSEPREVVLATQLAAWHHLIKMLEVLFADSIDVWEDEIGEIKNLMMKSEAFLARRCGLLASDIEQARANRTGLVADCPSCQQRAYVIGDGIGATCLVCERTDPNPEDSAEAYMAATDASWKYGKDGLDDDLAWCMQCANQAVARTADDLKPAALDQLGATKGVLAEASEFDLFVCFACAEGFGPWEMDHCGYCGAFVAGASGGGLCPSCERGHFYAPRSDDEDDDD